MIDLIAHNFDNERTPEIKCLNAGFVRLVDAMPRVSYDPEITTCDHAIVQAARVSYGNGTKKVSEDKGLIRYLMRHRHTTPFEMIEFKFHCSMPIFTSRQWIRHRTANVNEMSGRYSVLPNKFYVPDLSNVRQQSTRNKQVSEGQIEDMSAQEFVQYVEEHCKKAYEDYERFLGKEIGREQARMTLPLNLYTEWYWKIDLHNLMHFLALRCDSHAQQEIRVFADAMLDLVGKLCPWTIEAWNDYHPMRGAVLLTRLEAESLKNGKFDEVPCGYNTVTHFVPATLNSENSREVAEWDEKKKRLGFF